jgi:hypothetical protein
VLFEAPEEPAEVRVLDRRVAFIITDILSDNAARTPAMGASSPLLLDFPAAVKTGTTNDYRDNWTVGYTPEIVVGVWTGNTDNTPMADGTSGLTGAAPIWHDYMVAIYEDPTTLAVLSPTWQWFTPPPGVEQRQVCVLSSLEDPVDASVGCQERRWEWFMVDVSGADAAPTSPPTLPDDVPRAQVEIEPGIWQLAVTPLDGGAAEALRPQPAANMPQEPLPRYCLIPQEAIEPESDVLFQWFISPPRFPDDAARARDWAYARNIPIMPAVLCDEEAIAQAVGGREGYGTWRINDPRPGDEVYGVLPIIGTADFDPGVIDFYKIELGFGNPVTRWVTLGEIHHQPVVNGELEEFHADGLPPGEYVLRLMLVLPDGNYPEPYEVPVTVVPTPPEE